MSCTVCCTHQERFPIENKENAKKSCEMEDTRPLVGQCYKMDECENL